MYHCISCCKDGRSAHIGPTTLFAVGSPGRLSARPVAETRPELGRNPQRLLKPAGIRTDPAMSAPHPNGDPLNANKAPSPPVAPPTCKVLLYGFIVEPMMLFVVSPMSIDMGTFVLTKTTAPACLSFCTKTPSSSLVFGSPIQLTYPQELSSPSR